MNGRDLLNFSVGPVGGALLSAISAPLLAWSFLPHDVGRNNLAQLVCSLFVIGTSLGLDQFYIREFHESRNRHLLLKTAFVPSIAVATLLSIALLPFGEIISKTLFGQSNETWYLLTSAIALFALVNRFQSIQLRMQEKQLAFSLSLILPKIVFVVLIPVVWLTGISRGFSTVLIISLIASIVSAIVLAWHTRSGWRDVFWNVRIRRADLALALQFGLPTTGAGLLFWALTAVNSVVLRHSSNLQELGVYSMAATLAGLAAVVQTIFSTIWTPMVYKWAASGSGLEKLPKVAPYATCAVSVMFVALGLFAPPLVQRILPPEYRSVSWLLIACSSQPLLYALSEVTVVHAYLARQSKQVLLSSACSVCASAFFAVVFIPHFGAAGAACATALSFTAFLILRTEFSATVAENPLPRSARLQIYIPCSLSCAASIVSSLAGPNAPMLSAGLWTLMAILFAWMFRREFRDARLFILRRLPSRA